MTGPPSVPARNRWLAETGGRRGAEYAARFDALEASGADVHGEAAFVDRLLDRGSTVVDAGCGTGRVARELARRGHVVTGVDLDESMLAVARERAPELTWVLGDLVDVTGEQVGAPVDCVVMAGNVVVYLTPGGEAAAVHRVAGWLRLGGLLVAGFATDRDVRPADYRAWCHAAGLAEVAAHSTWDGAPEDPAAEYLVLVHRR